MPAADAWISLLSTFTDCFTRPGKRHFLNLMTAWALLPGRRTLTRIWSVIPEKRRGSYGALARFIRVGQWDVEKVWSALATTLVTTFVAPDGVVELLVDDTLLKKTGRQIGGAGYFRDAVRSTASRIVYAWGLNVVVVALCVRMPWRGQPLALPIFIDVNRKDEVGKMTTIERAVVMIGKIARSLPGREIMVTGDGAYAALAGYEFEANVHVTSRIRRDAAIYELAPPRTGKRGRPRLKGARLPSPREMAADVSEWTTSTVSIRDREVRLLLCQKTVLWYGLAKSRPLLMVLVRDPDGHQSDAFFFTTNTAISAPDVVRLYATRWAIEVSFRDSKQSLGAEDPQSWAGLAPERIAALSFILHSTIWAWFASLGDQPLPEIDRPYQRVTCPSFADALATLRAHVWTQRIIPHSASQLSHPKFRDQFIAVLAYAA